MAKDCEHETVEHLEGDYYRCTKCFVLIEIKDKSILEEAGG